MIKLIEQTIEQYNEIRDDVIACFDSLYNDMTDIEYLRDNSYYNTDYLEDISFKLNNDWLMWIEEQVDEDSYNMYYYSNSNEVFSDIAILIRLNLLLVEFYEKYDPDNSNLYALEHFDEL